MLTLALATQEVLARRGRNYRWQVSYRRRYWNVDTQEFLDEAAFTVLDRSEVKSVGETRDQLDRAGLNEWRSSNVSITLSNTDNKWSDKNPFGLFKADAVARLGYEPQLMEFKVDSFFVHDDGTESQPLTYFLGRASAFDQYPGDGTVQITIESNHILYKRTSADKVSISVPEEPLVGVVDGINKTFFTSLNGVGRVNITRIRPNASPLRPGIDIQISQLDIHNQPAKIEFTNAPTAVSSDAPRAQYERWLLDQKIEELVKKQGEASGIPRVEQDIQGVVFSQQVINTRLYTTQADWRAGATRQNIDTETTADQWTRAWFLLDDFSDGDFTANPTWTIQASPVGWSTSILGGALTARATKPMFGSEHRINVPFTKAYGTWAFSHLTEFVNGPGTDNQSRIRFIFNSPSSYYQLKFSFNPASINPTVTFESSSGVLASLGSVLNGAFHDWVITRSNTGEFKIYLKASGAPSFTLMATVTDNSITTSGFFEFSNENFPTGSTAVSNFSGRLLYIYWGPGLLDPTNVNVPAVNNSSALWQNVEIDGTAGLINWISAVTTANLAVGTSVIVETATAPEDPPGSGLPGTFEAFTAVGPSGQVLSTHQRFLRARIQLVTTPYPTFDTPTVLDSSVLWVTASTTIKLANFQSPKTAFQAVSELAEIAGYEWGVSTRTGRPFFRQRSDSRVPNYTVRLSSLKDFQRITDGVDRVFNIVRVTYGQYDRLVTPQTQLDPRPHSRDKYYDKPLNVTGGSILINPDADIATGLSRFYFERFKLPRRRFELVIDFAPHLELSDVVLMLIGDKLPNPPWFIGDTAEHLGDRSIHLYGEAQQSAYNILGKVLSLRHSKATMTTGLELEEIP